MVKIGCDSDGPASVQAGSASGDQGTECTGAADGAPNSTTHLATFRRAVKRCQAAGFERPLSHVELEEGHTFPSCAELSVCPPANPTSSTRGVACQRDHYSKPKPPKSSPASLVALSHQSSRFNELLGEGGGSQAKRKRLNFRPIAYMHLLLGSASIFCMGGIIFGVASLFPILYKEQIFVETCGERLAKQCALRGDNVTATTKCCNDQKLRSETLGAAFLELESSPAYSAL
eukprot:6210972-Pleurochrysis_carterae.AAC.8